MDYSIATLKQLLMESDKLDKVWDYFFELMDKGLLLKNSHPISTPTKDDTLRGVLAAIHNSANWQLGQEITVTGLAFSKTPSEHFYQGTCVIQNTLPPAVVFYFSDIELGAFVYSKNGQNEMFRFSLTQITDPKTLTRH
ncbi:hypothetical protein [Mycoavidus sp. B2-EB]|uniref:hypothetical protein n=1 Tax=Mycoavidus sp. B2-EB TaxID=2651972 RepID=UPI0016287F8B|nr:hypothetical protein [Mycoavidus sp. B2-EB]BBO60460.1 hypothetical protein MPB2EB_1602 [Mycoavidus sp. B2-EB]